MRFPAAGAFALVGSMVARRRGCPQGASALTVLPLSRLRAPSNLQKQTEVVALRGMLDELSSAKSK